MSGWGPKILNSYETNVALGLIPGHSSINVQGRASGLGVTGDTFKDIWDGNPSIGQWTAPTEDRIHAIVSTSTDDTLVGTGAQKVFIRGVSNNLKTTETIEMNGTTPVNTVNAYDMINRMDVIQSGSTFLNQGDISATAATDSTVTALMLTGNNRNFTGIYKTAGNEQLLFSQFIATVDRSGGGGTDADFRIVNFLQDLNIITSSITVGTSTTGTSALSIELKYLSNVPANTYLVTQAAPTQTATNVNSFINGVSVVG